MRISPKVKRIMFLSISIIGLIVLAVVLFLQHPLFGGKIDKKYKTKYASSKNFKDGVFENQSFTPAFADGVTYWDVLKEMLFTKTTDTRPLKPFSFQKTDLHTLDLEENILVWFGHSSYYFQYQGLRYLVDPVLTPNASPVFGSNLAFDGASIYGVEDIPSIDYLIITHDHYDHLDYTTIKNLQPKIQEIICPLGVSIHFDRWGYDLKKIHELDWEQEFILKNEDKIVALPARHFSGRTFQRNTTLWASFLLISPEFKMYIGGDSGYDNHFKLIGEQYGPLDLAILENGQYNKNWRNIHLMPEDFFQATLDLKAEAILPVHSSKFKLAAHPWYEPLEKVTEILNAYIQEEESNLQVLTPQIGQKIDLNQLDAKKFSPWWREYMKITE